MTSLSQTIQKLNQTLESLSQTLISPSSSPELPLSTRNAIEMHLKIILPTLLGAEPTPQYLTSIASYFASHESLQFTDLHLSLLHLLDESHWSKDDSVLLNVLCGRCCFLQTEQQRRMIVNHLNASKGGIALENVPAPQEWAGDLLDMWLRHLREAVQERRRGEDAHIVSTTAPHSAESTDPHTESTQQRTLPLNVFKLFNLILQKQHSEEQFPLEWQKTLLHLIMQNWHDWSREEKDFILRNIFTLALERNLLKEDLLQWLWMRAKAYSGIHASAGATTTKLNPNKTYQILCQFFDHFFTSNNGVDLRFDEDFWHLLFDGLKKTHSFILKRCEYLLKRIIEISKTDTEHTQYTKYFVFNSSTPRERQEDEKLWDTWFMLWDTVLSHSTHLLQPVWGEIFRLFPLKNKVAKDSAHDADKTSTKRGAAKKNKSPATPSHFDRDIHPMWTQILFHHGLYHENFGIQKVVLASLYGFDFSTYILPFSIDQVLDVIFNAGDVIKLYQDKYSIGHRMIAFMKAYCEQLNNSTGHVDELIQKMIFTLSRAIGGAESNSSLGTTFAGFSYFLKLILLIDRSMFENKNLLTPQLVQQLVQVYNVSTTISGGWIVVRQNALICELLIHLGEVTAENVQGISHLLSLMSDKVMALPSLERRLREHLVDDILLEHMATLLSEYFDAQNSLFDSFENAQRLQQQAHRAARLLRFVQDSNAALSLIMQYTESTLEGIYSRSYLSLTQKFKALTLVHAALHETNQSAHHGAFASTLVQSLVLPNLNELLSFAGTHLVYPDLTTTGYTRTHLEEAVKQSAVYREGAPVVLCDKPIFDLLRFLLLHSTLRENTQLLQFMAETIVKRGCIFVEDLNQVFGGSLLVRNMDAAQALACNLLLFRFIGGMRVVAQFMDAHGAGEDQSTSLMSTSHLTKPLLTRALDATRNVPLLMTSKDAATPYDQMHTLEKSFLASNLNTKLCKEKWDTIYHWLHYCHKNAANPQLNLLSTSDDSILKLIDEALDALDLINSRATSIPLACTALALSLIENESSLTLDTLRHIVHTAESAASSTSHGTEIECYFALLKILLGHKFALTNKAFVQEILLPTLNALVEKSVKVSRLITPVVVQVAQTLVNPAIDAHLKGVLSPIILQLFSNENEDAGIQGQDAVEKVHTDFITSPVDTELSIMYPPATNFEQHVNAYLYLAIYNLPQNSDAFVDHLLHYLLEQGASMKVPRFAPNSVEHLRMIRTWKLLLVLTPRITEKICTDHSEPLWDTVGWDRPHSVRRLMEFFMVVLFSKFPSMVARLVQDCKEINAPAGISISRQILLGSVISFGPRDIFLQYAQDVFAVALASCNSTHHNIRTIAQTMLLSIVRRREKFIREGLMTEESFPLSEDAQNVRHYIETNEACMKWVEKYHPVFMFDPFVNGRPEKLLLNDLETHDKTHVNDCVPLSVFRTVKEQSEGYCAAVCNNVERDTSRLSYYLEDWHPDHYVQNIMKEFEPKSDSYRDFADEVVDIYRQMPKRAREEDDNNDSNQSTIEVVNFQRKLVPWQDMDVTNELNPRVGREEGLHSLIVCATFVDKIPNLAGLTRTCEIFAAEKLVIANKGVMRMDIFKSISVTAENWMPIEEVPEVNLMQYLLDMKAEGYTIVGLEQTSDSVGIDEYAFPKKCLVLLGKEREGIPTEYLQLLDACVEIEQFGLIRSLNVHVSASILMYEYTKQHYMRGSLKQAGGQ